MERYGGKRKANAAPQPKKAYATAILFNSFLYSSHIMMYTKNNIITIFGRGVILANIHWFFNERCHSVVVITQDSDFIILETQVRTLVAP